MINYGHINILRVIAVCLVVLFHMDVYPFYMGFIGVDFFFVISGFLVSYSINVRKSLGGFSILGFMKARALRLYPALLVTITMFAPIFYYYYYSVDAKMFGVSIFSSLFFVSNFYFHSTIDYFSGLTQTAPLLHTWSLSVEVQCYILLALLSKFSEKLKIQKLIVLGLFLSSLCVSILGVAVEANATYLLPFGRLYQFLLGYYAFIHRAKLERYFYGRVCYSILVIFLLLCLAHVIYLVGIPYPGIAAVLVSLVPVVFISSGAQFLNRFQVLNHPYLAFVGRMTYSIYLVHFPVIAILKYHGVDEDFIIEQVLMIISLAIVVQYFEDWHRKTFGIMKYGTMICLIVVILSCVALQKSIAIKAYDLKLDELIARYSNANDYNSVRFDALEGITLDNGLAPKPKILIVGDSFAKDLLNIFAEGNSNLLDTHSFATLQESGECGVFTPLAYKIFWERIPVSSWFKCYLEKRKRDQYLSTNIAKFDEIWLASRWEDWVPKVLEEQLKNWAGPKLLIFGIKDFGDVNLRKIAHASRGLSKLEGIMNASAIKVELEFSELELPREIDYYPLLYLSCDEKSYQCTLTNDTGELLTIDGGHLTQAGARFFSEKFQGPMQDILTNSILSRQAGSVYVE